MVPGLKKPIDENPEMKGHLVWEIKMEQLHNAQIWNEHIRQLMLTIRKKKPTIYFVGTQKNENYTMVNLLTILILIT